MAWNQRCTHKRWDPEERFRQAGIHFNDFAKARLTQRGVRQRRQLQDLRPQSWSCNACKAPMGDGPAAAGQPTDDLQCLQARIKSTTRDIDALGRSCSAQIVVGFLSASDHPNAKLLAQCPQSNNTDLSVSRGPSYQKRTSPLAFPAEPRLVSTPCHLQKYKDRKKRTASNTGTRRRRWARRTACSETEEDVSSISSDVRIKSKARMRQRRPQ